MLFFDSDYKYGSSITWAIPVKHALCVSQKIYTVNVIKKSVNQVKVGKILQVRTNLGLQINKRNDLLRSSAVN